MPCMLPIPSNKNKTQTKTKKTWSEISLQYCADTTPTPNPSYNRSARPVRLV